MASLPIPRHGCQYWLADLKQYCNGSGDEIQSGEVLMRKGFCPGPHPRTKAEEKRRQAALYSAPQPREENGLLESPDPGHFWICGACGMPLWTEDLLKQHQTVWNNECDPEQDPLPNSVAAVLMRKVQKYHCPTETCDRTFKEQSHLAAHGSCAGVISYLNMRECGKCFDIFAGDSYLEKHVRETPDCRLLKKLEAIANEEEICLQRTYGLYRCPKCEVSFDKVQELRNHKSVNKCPKLLDGQIEYTSRGTFRCPGCNIRNFASPQHVRSHGPTCAKVDSGRPVHKCGLCTDEFERLGPIGSHYERVHKRKHVDLDEPQPWGSVYYLRTRTVA